MRISFAGGAEFFNCDKLFAAGIWPITVATTILKPGGYNRLHQMVEKVEKLPYRAFSGTDSAAISDLSAASHTDLHHLKPIKPLPARKSEDKVPLIDCFTAPCKGGCPIHQDIPEYIELVRRGLYGPALKLITEKNPLPFLTGTICAHRCQNKCTRNFYDESVHIRDTKLVAAAHGYDALMASIRPTEKLPGKKAAIIGGGPTGIAAAYFLARGGVQTTIFEREEKLGGVPRYVIPAFRISDEAHRQGRRAHGAPRRRGQVRRSGPERGRAQEAWATPTSSWPPAPGRRASWASPATSSGVIGWMKEMKQQVKPCLEGHVVVVGAGNTAMDAARVAKRMGAASSTIVYRRTKKEMPADEHELKLAIDEGVNLVELAAPVEQKDGKLICNQMKLGEPDASGRRSPVATGETFEIPCDLVISAIGEKVDAKLMAENGIEMGRKGPAFKTNVENVWCRRRRAPRPRDRRRGHCRRRRVCRGRHRRSAHLRDPRAGLSHQGRRHRQEGHAQHGRLRLLRGQPLPRLQHGLRKLRRFLPEPRQRRRQAGRRPPRDRPRRQDVQRVRQLHAVLPVRLRALPRQVHPLPDRKGHGREREQGRAVPRRRCNPRPPGRPTVPSTSPSPTTCRSDIETLILTLRSKYSYLYTE